MDISLFFQKNVVASIGCELSGDYPLLWSSLLKNVKEILQAEELFHQSLTCIIQAEELFHQSLTCIIQAEE